MQTWYALRSRRIRPSRIDDQVAPTRPSGAKAPFIFRRFDVRAKARTLQNSGCFTKLRPELVGSGLVGMRCDQKEKNAWR